MSFYFFLLHFPSGQRLPLSGTHNAKKTENVVGFLKSKHCYRDIWKVSPPSHRQHSCKYELLQPGTRSWEFVGCLMCVSTALCVLNPRQEKEFRPFESHLTGFRANTQYRDEMGGHLGTDGTLHQPALP